MNPSLLGLHHVTAIASDAQKNIDFYCGFLGLRLVKLTVNFDDPTSYHLYYGDALGRPGTVMTFFVWPGASRGRVGPPAVTATCFAVPERALPYWVARLAEHGAPATPVSARFGDEVLGFEDPDGMALEIVATPAPGGDEPTAGPIPAETAIRGFHGVTVSEEGYEKTATLLRDVMGFRADGQDGNRFRYRAGAGDRASVVDLLCVPDARRGTLGAGIVHHVAFRTPDDQQQREWRAKIAGLGYNVSPVMDRQYFHSIYFREPGGVLFEIATDSPGFAADEPADRLGAKLMLPPQFERLRLELEAQLPPVRLPGWTRQR
jgi:catechol 2,3-dioxygenase-like lactoylglutathione lyase family enzyme